MTKMIFEGQVDETEVSKLEEGAEIKVILGALEKDEFDAKLTLLHLKRLGGAVQFQNQSRCKYSRKCKCKSRLQRKCNYVYRAKRKYFMY